MPSGTRCHVAVEREGRGSCRRISFGCSSLEELGRMAPTSSVVVVAQTIAQFLFCFVFGGVSFAVVP